MADLPVGSIVTLEDSDGNAVYPVTSSEAIYMPDGTNLNFTELRTDMDDLQTEMTTVKTSVSEGKALVAAVVTGKGVQTAATDSFAQIATNINGIETLPRYGTVNVPTSETLVIGDIVYLSAISSATTFPYNSKSGNSDNMVLMFDKTNTDYHIHYRQPSTGIIKMVKFDTSPNTATINNIFVGNKFEILSGSTFYLYQFDPETGTVTSTANKSTSYSDTYAQYSNPRSNFITWLSGYSYNGSSSINHSYATYLGTANNNDSISVGVLGLSYAFSNSENYTGYITDYLSADQTYIGYSAVSTMCFYQFDSNGYICPAFKASKTPNVINQTGDGGGTARMRYDIQYQGRVLSVHDGYVTVQNLGPANFIGLAGASQHTYEWNKYEIATGTTWTKATTRTSQSSLSQSTPSVVSNTLGVDERTVSSMNVLETLNSYSYLKIYGSWYSNWYVSSTTSGSYTSYSFNGYKQTPTEYETNGTLIGTVNSLSPNQFPVDGAQEGFWYKLIG